MRCRCRAPVLFLTVALDFLPLPVGDDKVLEEDDEEAEEEEEDAEGSGSIWPAIGSAGTLREAILIKVKLRVLACAEGREGRECLSPPTELISFYL